jgi:outer membrane protein assembly factor BamB
MKRLLFFSLILLLAACSSASPPLMWSFRPQGSISTDLIAEGDMVYFATSSGKVYGLNRTTGRAAFNYTSTAGVYSSPAIHNSTLLFGCDNKIVYGIDKTTGNRTWTFLAESPIKAGVAVYDDLAYVGSDDGHLYALKPSSGKLIWSIRTAPPMQSKVLVDSWMLYFGGADRRVYSLSNVSRSPLWNRSLAGAVKSAPGIYKDIIYFPASDKRLYALDKYTGATLWNHTINGTVFGPPVVYGDSVLFGGGDRRLWSLNAYFGDVMWNLTMNDSLQAPLDVVDGIIYAASGSYVSAINASTGDVLWSLNSSGVVRYKPSFADGILVVAAGPLVQGYGGTADIRVTNITTEPALPAAGSLFSLRVGLANLGNSLAPDILVESYVDRVNLSLRTVTLQPGQEISLQYNMTASYGRHVAEAVADRAGRLVDKNKQDNRLGMVFATVREWPTFQGGQNRSGLLDLRERYLARDTRMTWSCSLNQSNRTYSDVRFLWDALNSTKDFRLSDKQVNASCFLSQSRGFFVGRLNSTWQCLAQNSSGYSDKTMLELRDYLNTFNESVYNLSVRHNALYYPFNITDFQVIFNCSATPNGELPEGEAMAVWDCKIRNISNSTPYNMLDAWACAARHYSNYSMDDLAKKMGYVPPKDLKGVIRPEISNYGLIWTYPSKGIIQSSPIFIDLDRSGDGMLETVFGSHEGDVISIYSNGSVFWSVRLNGSIDFVDSADIDRDGRLEVLTGSTAGELTALDFMGRTLWTYPTSSPVTSPSAVLNIDSDTEPEIVFGLKNGRLIALDTKGRFLWDYQTQDSVASVAIAADIDSNSVPELVFGSNDNTLYAIRSPPYKVWMYQTTGDVSGPKAVSAAASRSVDIVVASGDGNLYDIYWGAAAGAQLGRVCDSSGCSREEVATTRLRLRWNFTADSSIESSVSAADMDADGRSEYVIATTDQNIYIVNRSGARTMRTTLDGPIRTSPAIADLDNDGRPEIIAAADDGRVYIVDGQGKRLWDYKTQGFIRSSPAAADINNDGIVEFAAGSYDGSLYVFGIPTPEPLPSLSTTTTTSTTETTVATTSSETEPLLTTSPPTVSTVTTLAKARLNRAASQRRQAANKEHLLLKSPYEGQSAEKSPWTPPAGQREAAVYFMVAIIMGCFFLLVITPPVRTRIAKRLKDV